MNPYTEKIGNKFWWEKDPWPCGENEIPTAQVGEYKLVMHSHGCFGWISPMYGFQFGSNVNEQRNFAYQVAAAKHKFLGHRYRAPAHIPSTHNVYPASPKPVRFWAYVGPALREVTSYYVPQWQCPRCLARFFCGQDRVLHVEAAKLDCWPFTRARKRGSCPLTPVAEFRRKQRNRRRVAQSSSPAHLREVRGVIYDVNSGLWWLRKEMRDGKTYQQREIY